MSHDIGSGPEGLVVLENIGLVVGISTLSHSSSEIWRRL